ncbi:MAG: amidohydrolase [Armatimonadia bacterium]
MRVLRVENALLWTGVDDEVISGAALEAHDGQIVYAGPSPAPVCPLAPGDELEVIDAAGQLLMPGFVNAHTHLAMTLLRGYADDMPLKPWLEEKIWPTEMKLTGDDVYWGALLGAVEMLRCGVTCFCDMYHFFVEGTQAAVDAGIRALPSGVLLGFAGDPMDNLKKAVDFALPFLEDENSLVVPMLGPHAPYTCPDPLLESVAAAAHEHGLGVHIHLSETEHEVQESLQTCGVTPVRHLAKIGLLDCQVTAAHCVRLTDEDIEILTEKHVGVVHCPGSNMKLGSGFQPLPALLSAGAVVGLGTDGAASNNNLDLLEEARLAALIHKGYTGDPTVVSAREAMRLATRGGAEAVGLGDRIGTLEPGKRADFILVDLSGPHTQPVFDVLSQMVYDARSSDVTTTVVDGKVLVRNGEFTHIDVTEVVARANECAHRLTQA